MSVPETADATSPSTFAMRVRSDRNRDITTPDITLFISGIPEPITDNKTITKTRQCVQSQYACEPGDTTQHNTRTDRVRADLYYAQPRKHRKHQRDDQKHNIAGQEIIAEIRRDFLCCSQFHCCASNSECENAVSKKCSTVRAARCA